MGIIDNYAKGQEIVDTTLNTKVDPTRPFIADIDEDWITFGNIKCYDANGDIFESYPRLQLARSVSKKGNLLAAHTFFGAADEFERQKSFLPSYALSCNLLALLYQNRRDTECNSILAGYCNLDHIQNTIVDWRENEIIHYPNYSDASLVSHYQEMNSTQIRKKMQFTNQGMSDSSLENALGQSEFRKYIHNLTGLRDPSMLTKIGESCNIKTDIQVWQSYHTTKAITSTSLGGSCGIFRISTANHSGGACFSRAVRIEGEWILPPKITF